MPIFVSPFGGSGGTGTRVYGVPVNGVKNGTNRVFTTPDIFVSDSMSLFHNGRRLVRSAVLDPRGGEYVVLESGGVGTGYDVISFLTFAPNGSSQLFADYDTV